MKNAKPWLFPPGPKPVFWMVAGFKMTNEEARRLLGDPHYTETDSTKTYGGHEDNWAFTLESGQHLGISYQIPYGVVALYSDAPDMEEILEVLDLPAELVADKSRFERYDPPIRA